MKSFLHKLPYFGMEVGCNIFNDGAIHHNEAVFSFWQWAYKLGLVQHVQVSWQVIR